MSDFFYGPFRLHPLLRFTQPVLYRLFFATTRAIKKHNHRHKGFTASANDWNIVYLEEFENKTDSMAREKEIKSWKSAQRIKRLIGLEHSGL